jgi:hypothetical protein
VTSSPQPPAAPAVSDVVEIIDRPSANRVSATVESVDDHLLVLHLERAGSLPEEALVRWFDGATAWQTIAQLEHIGPDRVVCRLATEDAWQPSPARQSLRAPVDLAPMLVKIVDSRVLAKGRRVNTVCVDISENGCRTSWLGPSPRVRDAVDVAWNDGRQPDAAPEWVPARVARIIGRPFGATQVSFTFEITDATDKARVRALYHAWLQEHPRRTVAEAGEAGAGARSRPLRRTG